MRTECPDCDSDLRGDPIPPDYIERGFYGRENTHYNRAIGIEQRGIYDGVLFWACPDCGYAWPREFGAAVNLNRLSIEAAREANKARALGHT